MQETVGSENEPAGVRCSGQQISFFSPRDTYCARIEGDSLLLANLQPAENKILIQQANEPPNHRQDLDMSFKSKDD